jgi:glutathione S-transferase
MITLYGHPFSRAHRVMWMLKELGVAYDHVHTDFLRGGTREAAFLAVNPNGRVPALVDGEVTLFESLAINLYLARRYGGELAPRDVVEDGLATQWSFWVATEIEKPLLFSAANLMLFPEPDRRPDELQIGLRKLDRPLQVLEAHLRGRDYLLGDRFTVADLNVSAVMTLAPICDVPLGAYPRVSDWLSRCLERPAAADWKPIRFTVPRPTDAGLLAMFI